MTLTEHDAVAADGRRIGYLEGGDPGGYPVIGLHGTPGCRLSRWPDDSVYVDAGVRYITTDRAGYGRSDRHRGRRVVDEADDVRAVADAAGLGRFAVVGGSGGGPHALACGAQLADRVERVACQSSLASAPDGDVAFLERPDVIAAFTRIVVEQARHGVGGSVDDTLAFVTDWGFALSAVTVPVLLTFGDADTSCPPAHGRFLASAVPAPLVVETPGGGHFATEPRDEILATHRWLRTGRLVGAEPPPVES